MLITLIEPETRSTNIVVQRSALTDREPEVTRFPIHERYVLEPSAKTKKFSVSITSDYHLTNHGDQTHRPTLKEIGCDRNADTEKVFVILGDFVDFTSSWEHEDFMPYDRAGNILNPALLEELLYSIVRSNPEVFNDLKDFLQSSENSRVIYVTGNHDNAFLLDESLRERFSQYLLPGIRPQDRTKRILFTKSLEAPEFGFYSEHGHRFDPFNYSESGGPTWGDREDIKINLLVKELTKRIKGASLPEEVKKELTEEVKRINHIINTMSIPIFLQQLASNSYTKHLSRDSNVAKKAYEVIMSSTDDIAKSLLEIPIMNFPIVQRLASSRRFQHVVSTVAEAIQSTKIENNEAQKKEAARLREEGTRYFIAGHTHRAEEANGYINLGVFKPVIRGHRNNKGWVFEGEKSRGNIVIFKADFSSGRKKVEVRPY